MSNETKNNLKELWNKFVEQILKGNPLVIILVAIATFWAYENIFIPGKEKLEMVLTIGLGNATYTSLVEADVEALREELAKVKAEMNAILDARESGKIAETGH